MDRSLLEICQRTGFIFCLAGMMAVMTGCASTGTANSGCSYSDQEIADLESSAREGDAGSLVSLAHLYRSGLCVEKDGEKSLGFLIDAGTNGHVDAQRWLGFWYKTGYRVEVEKDVPTAFYWYSKAARQGDKQSQFEVGKMYQTGTGVAQDLDAASRWYEKAADQGSYRASNALAQVACENTLEQCAQNLKSSVASTDDSAFLGFEFDSPLQASEVDSQPHASEIVRSRPETRQRRDGWKSRRQSDLVFHEYGDITVRVSGVVAEMDNQKSSLAKSIATPFAGAGAGTLGGLVVGTCNGYCPTALGAAVGSAVGLVGGFLVGTGVMFSEFSNRATISKLDRVYQETDVSGRLQNQLVELGNTVLNNSVVAETYIEPTPQVRNSLDGTQGFDTILEISNLRSGFRSQSYLDADWEKTPTEFYISVNSRLIRSADNVVLGEWELEYQELPEELKQWARVDARGFQDTLDAGYGHLASQLYKKMLGLKDLSALLPEEKTDAVVETGQTGQTVEPVRAQDEKLSGKWEGEMYTTMQWPSRLSIEISAGPVEGYVAHVTGNTACNGTDINVILQSGNNYRASSSHNHNCQLTGSLEHNGEELKGKLRIKGWQRLATINLTRTRVSI